MKCLIVLCVFIIANGSAKNLPSFVHKCKPDYPEVNKCIIQQAEALKPYLAKGIPEMKIPAVDPIRITKVEFNTENQASTGFKASFTDLIIDGGIDFQVTSLDFDLKNSKIDIFTYIPKMRIRSNYQLKGKLLIFDLDSSGPADLNITDINSEGHYKVKIVTRNGKKYLDFDDGTRKFDYKNPTLYLGDIFKGNPELTENTNKVINENYREIEKDIKPLIEATTNNFINTVIIRVFQEFSLDELFE